MVTGNYEVMLKTPMGVKKGELVLNEDGTVLNGKLIVMGKENSIEPGTVEGDDFQFSGKLKSAIGMLDYSCAGNVSDDQITGVVSTKKGELKLSGKRK